MTTPGDKNRARGSQSDADDSQEVRDLKARIAALEAAQSTGGIPLNNVPHHAAGPGGEVAETWSQADQEASARGDQ